MSEKKIKDIKDLFENFDEIIGEGKSPFLNNKPTEKTHKYVKFHISESIMTGGNIALIVLGLLLVVGVPAIIELNFYHLAILAKILKVLFTGLLVFLVFKFNKNKPIIAEVFSTHLRVAENIPVGGKITNLLFLFKLIRNQFAKVDIPYESILSITRDKSFFSDGMVVIRGRDKNGSLFSFHSGLSNLRKEDLIKLKKILHAKGVKLINV